MGVAIILNGVIYLTLFNYNLDADLIGLSSDTVDDYMTTVIHYV